MNKFFVLVCFSLASITSAEPPVHHGDGYSYSLASSGSAHGIGTSGYSTVGGDGGHGLGGISSGYASAHGYDFGGGHHDGGLIGGGGGHFVGGHDDGGFIGLGGHDGGLIGGGDYTSVHSGHQTYEGQHVDPTLLHKVKEILLHHENLEESQRGSYHGHGGDYNSLSSHYGAPSSHYGVPSYHGSRVVGIELGHITPGIQVAQYHQSQHLAIPSGSYGAPSIHIPSGSYGVPHHHRH